MSVYLQDPDALLYHGDVREVLRELPDASVDCVATSPPFYGLRDYGTGSWEGGDEDCDHVKPRSSSPLNAGFNERWGNSPGAKKQENERAEVYKDSCGKCGARRVDKQIGLEATPDEWAAELVNVFRECRRVMKDSATLWIEIGDSFSNKQLVMQPFLLAFALKADGWYVRQIIIWAKQNAMPESVTDRCTAAHSYILLLSKRRSYYFDAEAIAEPATWERWGDQTTPKYEGTDTASGWMKPSSKAELQRIAERRANGYPTKPVGLPGEGPTKGRPASEVAPRGSKNSRSVWTIPTQGYPEAHFATWPEALCERIIKAGCPAEVCRQCGKPRERIVEKSANGRVRERAKAGLGQAHSRETHGLGAIGGTFQEGVVYETVGWSDCGCNAGWQPGTILDPFGGSGTTAHVARKLGRRSLSVELNEEYCKLFACRLAQLSLLAEAP